MPGELESRMASYYVNKNAQPNGDHEVHVAVCSRMPEPQNSLYVGDHATCVTAVAAARRQYSQANGCFYCSLPCHTQ